MAAYPGAIKTWVDKVDLTDFMTAGILNDDVMDEIIAIETELGTDPAGAEVTVKARLDAMISDAAYAAGWNGDTTHAPSKNAVYDKIEALGGIPSGIIALWHGTIANIPSGWVICDGNNSTPNLLDKFVKSVPTAVTNPGTTGGASTHVLTVAELATHAHTIKRGGGSGSAACMMYQTDYLSAISGPVGNAGSGSAHENEPQHYEVAFIMKT